MMMKTLFPLLLSLLLLCGCAAQNPEPETADDPVIVLAESSERIAPSDSGYITKTEEADSIQRWYLRDTVSGFLPMGENLLLFSGTDATALILLDTQTQTVLASHETGTILAPENATVQLLENGISYFNSASLETVILDSSLREVRRISAPEDLTGMPLLSSDSRTLYYCTPTSLRALDLSSSISRVLKEASYPTQGLSGLLMDDTILQVSITDTDGSWRTLFLSSETGQLLQEQEGSITPKTAGDRYFLHFWEGGIQTILFGQTDGSTMALHPRHSDVDCFFLSDRYGIVTAGLAGENTCLELYDLKTGSRTAALTLSGMQFPHALTEIADRSIWFLTTQEETGETLLSRWDPTDSAVSDSNCYSSTYYTRGEPDYDGLAACSLYAQELSEKHGIDILVYKDAVAKEPWDYRLEYEYQATILRRELEALDARLSNFPEGFLQTLAGKFTDLNICIVRSATGSPESGSLEAVNGIQFMEGFDAYIVLATDHDTEYALYHELSHLMETVVLTESTAYDRWDNLNPSDFQYDNDYISNQSRDGSPWLQSGKEYFIDTYSMSYAKEDRARLFEYAMTAGHEDLFRSPNLQAKLRQLCLGLREAFGLTKSEETFLWEQYLNQ